MSGRVIADTSKLQNLAVLTPPDLTPMLNDQEQNITEIVGVLKDISAQTKQLEVSINNNIKTIPGDIKALGNLCTGLSMQLRDALGLMQSQSVVSQRLLEHIVSDKKRYRYESVPVKSSTGGLLKWITEKVEIE